MDSLEDTRSYELFGGSEAPFAARLAVESVGERLDPPVRSQVRLLVSELVTNAVRHAGTGPEDQLGLVISTSPRAVRVEVADGGPGFAVSGGAAAPRHPIVTTAAGPGGEPVVAESGWGLFLVDELADRWGVDRSGHGGGGRGTRVWFEIDRA